MKTARTKDGIWVTSVFWKEPMTEVQAHELLASSRGQ